MATLALGETSLFLTKTELAKIKVKMDSKTKLLSNHSQINFSNKVLLLQGQLSGLLSFNRLNISKQIHFSRFPSLNLTYPKRDQCSNPSNSNNKSSNPSNSNIKFSNPSNSNNKCSNPSNRNN